MNTRRHTNLADGLLVYSKICIRMGLLGVEDLLDRDRSDRVFGIASLLWSVSRTQNCCRVETAYSARRGTALRLTGHKSPPISGALRSVRGAILIAVSVVCKCQRR